MYKRQNYHNKSFALRLALKERLRGTRKWPIRLTFALGNLSSSNGNENKHLGNDDYFVIIPPSSQPLLLKEYAANGPVEAPLK